MTSLITENNLSRNESGFFDDGTDDAGVPYSDGAQTEAYLREVLRQATDLSSTSAELNAKVQDWATEYHLSPLRANLLRALNLNSLSRVLELGCGCGAITRYLGEQGLEVDAIEGSRARAELAALRCRGLDNVNIITANFNELKLPARAYDAVFLIGVTEYAKRFSKTTTETDEEALIALLQQATRALTPTGVMMIAIENRVGLKYMLGANEDHHGKRYIGIHNYHPDSAGIRTYDRQQWKRILQNAKVAYSEFLLPFPDYKLPTVLLSENYIKDNQYAYCHLDNIRSRDYLLPLELDQPESLFWEALCNSGTLCDHSNSFFIAASHDSKRVADVCELDFAHLPEFQRPVHLSCVVSKRRNCSEVERTRIRGADRAASDYELPGLIHQVGTEPFHHGVLLSIEWARSLLIEAEVARFEHYLRTYYQFLSDFRARQPLPIDLLPANIVITPKGEFVVFDQEWKVNQDIELDFVFFRAMIWFALRYHQRQALEVIRKRLNIQDVRKFVKYGFDTIGQSVTDDVLDKYVSEEHEFQTRIKGAQADPIVLDTPLVGDRPVPAPVSRVYWRIADRDFYSERNCCPVELSMATDRQSLIYDLPPDANPMTHFRFDPCEARRPADFGFMHLYAIEVFLCADAEVESIWRSEGAENIARQARLSGMQFHHASLGSVFAIADHDPYLEFKFIPRRLPRGKEHYRVVVDLTCPRSADYMLAQDRYLVREEIMSRRLRYLEDRLADQEKVEQELYDLKRSKAWRMAEIYRALVHHRIKPALRWINRHVAAARRHGVAGSIRHAYARLRPSNADRERQRATARTPYEIWLEGRPNTLPEVMNGPLISILMPVYNVDPSLLRRAVQSVQQQSYRQWELCIVDDCSTRHNTREFLRTLEGSNIKVKYLSRNLNIAGASNEALSLARGDYIALLDNDDELAAGALAHIADCAVTTNADIIYSDEDFIRPDGHLDYPHFKPDYSPDLLLSHNYITHFLALKRELVDAIRGFRPGFDGAQDYELLLRAVEQAKTIEHIAEPLYHWRMTPGSTSLDSAAKPEAHANGKRALIEALARRGIKGTVLDANLPNFFRVKRELTGRPLVSIIIPFKDKPELLKQALDSILTKSTYENYEILGISNNTVTTTTFDLMLEYQQKDQRISFIENNVPFSFSKLVNAGVAVAHGEHVVLFNNDIELLTPEWIEGLLEHSQRDDVAVVGGKLYYPNNTVQHAGVGIGLGGYAGHFHKNFPAHATGYFNRLNIIQNVSALTAALFMVEKNVYTQLGGFDENLVVAYNDIDFCLRARGHGYFNVFTPYVEAYHHESISRGYEDTPEKQTRFESEKRYLKAKYSDLIKSGDPYYNVNFDQGRDDFSI